MKRFLALVFVLFVAAVAATAQSDSTPDDNGFLTNMLQRQLSGPGREIQLSGVSGLLSSRARIENITVSDDQGPWLRLENVGLDWRRTALLLGRVSINRLSADRVTLLRRPDIPAQTPTAEAKPFALPELPVQIRLRDLQIGQVALEAPVAGVPAVFSVNGGLDLVRGALDTTLAIHRLDAPGGSLDLTAAFSNSTRQLALDLHLQEPDGGLLSKLLRIENEPALDLRLAGNGPLDNVDVTFSLDADQDRVAGGTVALRAKDEGLGFTVDLKGGIAPLIPAQFRDFFAGTTTIAAQGVSKSAGGLSIDNFALNGAVLTLAGNFATTPDGFPRALDLTGALGDPAGPAITLPVPGGATTLNSAQLHISYGQSSRWTGLLALDRLAAGTVTMEDVTLNMGGLAQNLDDPDQRNVTITLEGLATGVSSSDADTARALGPRIDLFADAALPPNAPAEIRQLQISGNGLSIFSAGTLKDWVYTGQNSVRIDDIAPFGGLARRDVSGAVDLRADGSVSPLTGGFDLTLDGTTTDLRLSEPRIDGLMTGQTTLAGRVVRDETGIRADGLRLGNAQMDFASDGRISSASTDIGFTARISDLALIDPRLGGEITATGTARGDDTTVAVALNAAIPQGRLLDRPLTDFRLGFQGDVAGTDVTGTVSGGGALGDMPITLAGDITATSDRQAIEGLTLAVGPNTATGALARDGTTGPFTGKIALRAPDIAPLAAFALRQASGEVNADLLLAADSTGGQGITLSANGARVAVGANTANRFQIDAQVTDALGIPLVNGGLTAADLMLGGVGVTSVTANATQIDQTRMTFATTSQLAIGTLLSGSGALDRLNPGVKVTLDALTVSDSAQTARLTAPTTISVVDGTATLTPLTLDFGTGTLTAQGSVGETVEAALDITNLPLAITNTIAPALGLGGQINGTARVTGPRAAPNITFQLSGRNIESANTRAAGVPRLSLDATGATEGERLRVDIRGTGATAGLSARVEGLVPLRSGGLLDLNATLEAFPLRLIDRLAGNRGLTGTASGTARVTGPITDPNITFDLRGADLGATLLTNNGIPLLNLAANGNYLRRVVTIQSARVTGAGGLDLTGSGRVPLTGPGLDVAVAGAVPLSLADSVLSQRDAQAAGLLRVNANVRGALTAPQITGGVTLAGGTLVDPQTNIRLNDITLDIALANNTVELRTVRANVAAGGGVSANGTVSLDAGRRFPADITIRINDVVYTDGTFINTRLAGDLAVQGPLIGGGGLVSGQIDLGETEISVSEGLGANANAALEQVVHKNTPAGVRLTLQRAQVGAPTPPRSSNRTDLTLDVRIRAPRQIFVRGRGLDVEVGGEMVVRGTMSDIQPVGQFDLRRGRLSILAQRIDFEEGSLQLVGNLDPQIHFVARTVSDDVTAIVTVDGRASEPEITFSSEPELPQDEVLARIIFNRSAENLSAFQLAQLAAAAAELAGGGGNGLMDQLRSSTGLDDLDIITLANGSTAIRAGRYLADDVYVEVQTGSDGVSRAQINLDVNKYITARGSVASDGNTTIGLFYERDY